MDRPRSVGHRASDQSIRHAKCQPQEGSEILGADRTGRLIPGRLSPGRPIYASDRTGVHVGATSKETHVLLKHDWNAFGKNT